LCFGEVATRTHETSHRHFTKTRLAEFKIMGNANTERKKRQKKNKIEKLKLNEEANKNKQLVCERCGEDRTIYNSSKLDEFCKDCERDVANMMSHEF
jgi:ribosomal protein S14